jgi:hypothetical protein
MYVMNRLLPMVPEVHLAPASVHHTLCGGIMQALPRKVVMCNVWTAIRLPNMSKIQSKQSQRRYARD